MRKIVAAITWFLLSWPACAFAAAPPTQIKVDVVTITVEQQYEAVRSGGKSAMAVHFEMAKDWHFYASAETAVGGMNLKLEPSGPDYVSFSQPIFPKAHTYFDKALGQRLNVFSENFTVFIPFTVSQTEPSQPDLADATVEIGITGAVCSGFRCRVPNFGKLGTVTKISRDAPMGDAKFVVPAADVKQPGGPASMGRLASYSVLGALGLALLAGLLLNIMPCVWPVLPLIIMRIVEQAKQSKMRSILMGLCFCLGILLFFACFAAFNIILKLVTGTVLGWGDHFRNPVFVAGMALLLVVMALFMFGVFTIGLPSSIAGKSDPRKGFVGSVGMGLLAAILSTPCSFGILLAVLGWAQAQPLPTATIAIMFIGLGMALPYAILTSMPGLLTRLPKAGRWMELFKQALGFVLLAVAAWLIMVLPQQRRTPVLYFAVALAFCVWVWGTWVTYGTARLRKWVIRIIAVAVAVILGWALLKPPTKLIDWQPYDAGLIESAISEQKPVLIKFYADWCLSCKVIEKVVYSRKDVAELIDRKKVFAIKADTTAQGYPATIDLKNKYSELGVPVSMLFLPGRKEPVRWYDKTFADELKNLLQKLPAR
ncbi:MAG: protein-disulfide reductase DsbD family protein [Planctomycetota bacterium]|jgi:thiol:disulfide interchange protein